MASSESRSAHIRSRLSHPVIDADGHIVESTPVLLDYMREVGGHATGHDQEREEKTHPDAQGPLRPSQTQSHREAGKAATH